jgi:mRNA interferase YafQ
MIKRGSDVKKIAPIIKKLAKGRKLPEKNKDHKLTGIYKAKRECHIRPDWLLIYEISHNDKTLYLIKHTFSVF